MSNFDGRAELDMLRGKVAALQTLVLGILIPSLSNEEMLGLYLSSLTTARSAAEDLGESADFIAGIERLRSDLLKIHAPR